MSPAFDPDYVIAGLALAKAILPPAVKLLRRLINKSITVIVITRDK